MSDTNSYGKELWLDPLLSGPDARSRAERIFELALYDCDQFDDELPMRVSARAIFRSDVVPQLSAMFREMLDRSDYDGAREVYRLWAMFVQFSYANSPLGADSDMGQDVHLLQRSDLAAKDQNWRPLSEWLIADF